LSYIAVKRVLGAPFREHLGTEAKVLSIGTEAKVLSIGTEAQGP
jgi:hypothetical protein